MNSDKTFENKFDLKPDDLALLNNRTEVKVISLEFDGSFAIIEDPKTNKQILLIINKLTPKKNERKNS